MGVVKLYKPIGKRSQFPRLSRTLVFDKVNPSTTTLSKVQDWMAVSHASCNLESIIWARDTRKLRRKIEELQWRFTDY